MEDWTFIHKVTNDIIRFGYVTIDSDFGYKYYFSDCEFSSPWFSFKREDLEFLVKTKDIHPMDSMNYNLPNTDMVNLNDYNITKLSS